MPPSRLIYSIADICAATGLGRFAIFQEMKSGRLAFYHIGARRVVDAAALDQWLDNHRSAEATRAPTITPRRQRKTAPAIAAE